MSAATSPLDSKDPASPTYYAADETAVLVLDFHSFIVEMLPTFRTVARRCSDLIDWAHGRGITVVHGLVDLTTGPAPAHLKSAPAFNMYREKYVNNKDELEDYATRPAQAQLDSGSDIVFPRPIGTASALRSAELSDWLRTKCIKSLIITGLSTSGCVLSTGKAAADQGYVVTIIKDGCYDRTEEKHLLCLELLQNQCHILTFDELAQAFQVCALRLVSRAHLRSSSPSEAVRRTLMHSTPSSAAVSRPAPACPCRAT